MLGLKRGTVILSPHESEWETEAAHRIAELKEIFGDGAADIQHVGSTAVRGIRAKPIVDLAVGMRDLSSLPGFLPLLAERGYVGPKEERPGEFLFVRGTEEIRTHHVHVVRFGSAPWRNSIRFRDRLNGDPELAAAYDRLKAELFERYASDRASYTAGKAAFIAEVLAEPAEE